ncbi:MAG TPA: hypothetical protein VFK54_05345 [Candidatus Limnocylindrales bacterium]|nr:hypothetical protein [Candidatus Limnocylindrales bacterium]
MTFVIGRASLLHAPRPAALVAAAALVLGGCDLAALGTGRTDCGQLSSVECREALLLAAQELGPAPGEVIADRTCLDGACVDALDWIVVYPLPDAQAIALRITGGAPNAPLGVRIVRELPSHVAVRLPSDTELLASRPPVTPAPP